MGWAINNIISLLDGKTVQFRPHGNSMLPRIKSGDLCTVEPISDHSNIHAGDVVLCKVRGKEYLHLVSATRDGRFQVSNNNGFVNGWVGPQSVYGKLVKVE